MNAATYIIRTDRRGIFTAYATSEDEARAIAAKRIAEKFPGLEILITSVTRAA